MIQDFKNFVKNNPSMIKHVQSGEMTWQKFYELYDLYGEKEDVWEPYITKKQEVKEVATSSLGFTDILSFLKQADLSKIEESINSVQRVIGVLQDLGNNNTTQTETYKPRPIYKHFED